MPSYHTHVHVVNLFSANSALGIFMLNMKTFRCSHLVVEEDAVLPPKACTLIDGPKQTHDQATNEVRYRTTMCCDFPFTYTKLYL